jgi:raffinose/stachyose/melibiose transport system substrate-binding protein
MSPHTRRRTVATTAVLAVAALTLTACSSGGSSGGSRTADLSSPAPTGVTLTLWHNSGDSQALLDLYQAYEKASGNTIDLVDLPSDTFPTAVQTKWAAGDRPDLLEYLPTPQDMAQLNMSENMIDLSSMSFVEAEGNLATSAGTIDGKTYGAILGPIATFGAFYNKDVLTKAGLDVPTSYADLAADCSALKAAGVTPISVGAGSEFPANMIAGFAYMADFNAGDAYGKSIASGSAKVNDADGPLLKSLTAVDDLRKDGCLNSNAATATFTDSVNDVYAGKAALTILPSDFIANFYEAGDNDRAAVDAKIGFGAVSAEKGIASYSPGSYGTYFVPKTGNSEKERAAEDFIEWVTTDGYQQYVDDAQIVPTLSTATAPDLTGMNASMKTMLTDPDSTPAFNNSIPGFGNFGKIAVGLVAGQSTPQEAADKFNTYVQQAIAAAK